MYCCIVNFGCSEYHAEPWANPLLLCRVFHLSSPICSEEGNKQKECPVSDFEMCTGAGLEKNVLVMRHCLLILFSVPVLFLWFGGLGFGPARHRIMSQSNMWSSYRGTCICALGKAGNQDGVCGSFEWFRVWKMLISTYAKQMWCGGVTSKREFQYNDLIYALCVVRWKVLKIAFTAFCGVPSKAAFNTSAIEARPRVGCWLV